MESKQHFEKGQKGLLEKVNLIFLVQRKSMFPPFLQRVCYFISQFFCYQTFESTIHFRKGGQLQSTSQMDFHGLAGSPAPSLIDYVSWLKYQLITLHGIPLQQSRELSQLQAHQKIQVATPTNVKMNTQCSSIPSSTWISVWFISLLLTNFWYHVVFSMANISCIMQAVRRKLGILAGDIWTIWQPARHERQLRFLV